MPQLVCLPVSPSSPRASHSSHETHSSFRSSKPPSSCPSQILWVFFLWPRFSVPSFSHGWSFSTLSFHLKLSLKRLPWQPSLNRFPVPTSPSCCPIICSYITTLLVSFPAFTITCSYFTSLHALFLSRYYKLQRAGAITVVHCVHCGQGHTA